jgi:hypothetical protein
MNAYELLPNRDLLDGAGLPGVTRATQSSSFCANFAKALRVPLVGVVFGSCAAAADGPGRARKFVKNLQY